ncbi:CvfB family protein [Clostridium cylindrosporum]|uniref:S1 motif domain-containing protein n=1 Tax=Clostridium cylindrosporum DSM 605 TaxID=1121307 RepID=A0A0J8FZH7_CLOCY|nr:S1-like domain-containing RNA-binding protein [Clostridium cylindrosporum]KMT20996.1 hypothetical protein CLCY_1c02300 [Clostridium cylindrosporum DSM 605]
MIELGKIQKLRVIREVSFGVYLNFEEDSNGEDILLPIKQVPENIEIGDEIEVFVYRDSEDRIIATTKKPKITMDNLAVLEVVDNTSIGAFLDWGLEKDLFLPFKQQLKKVVKGNSYLVGLYIDKANRLCATMKVYDMLSSESPYTENDMVQGTIYKINNEIGAFVAVDDKYHGLILNKEFYGDYKEGDSVEVRVKKVRNDGKLELSLRKQAYKEIESDSKRIMDALEENKGEIMLNDKSDPEDIKNKLSMSKGAFKRAVGRLLKEGAIEITDKSIRRTW